VDAVVASSTSTAFSDLAGAVVYIQSVIMCLGDFFIVRLGSGGCGLGERTGVVLPREIGTTSWMLSCDVALAFPVLEDLGAVRVSLLPC
jgi:hypothetical protein